MRGSVACPSWCGYKMCNSHPFCVSIIKNTTFFLSSSSSFFSFQKLEEESRVEARFVVPNGGPWTADLSQGVCGRTSHRAYTRLQRLPAHIFCRLWRWRVLTRTGAGLCGLYEGWFVFVFVFKCCFNSFIPFINFSSIYDYNYNLDWSELESRKINALIGLLRNLIHMVKINYMFNEYDWHELRALATWYLCNIWLIISRF